MATAATPKRRRSLPEKLQHERAKHCLREPCSCSKNCIERIPQHRRIDIYMEFWSMEYNKRKNFIHQTVEQKEANRTLKASRKREVYYIYRFSDGLGVIQSVCKKFYLGTLGYCATSPVVHIAKTAPASISATPDQRGRKRAEPNHLHKQIDQHIQLYNPCISHYCHEDAPNRLYLPHGLTIKEMHHDFLEQNPLQKLNYSTYVRRIGALNISLAQLGEEECELCLKLDRAQHSCKEVNTTATSDCASCGRKNSHLDLANEARQAYTSDGSEMEVNKMVRSVDLQKVMMMPRLPGIKSACSTRRLVTFHHTFAPVGAYSASFKPVSVLWHEATSGRKCEDIASAVDIALREDRDSKYITYFMDNCAVQNKNYALYTSLLAAVNSTMISTEILTIKYFEAGHSFMSADSFHASVERKLKKMVNVYDFNDFVYAVQEAGAKTLVPNYTEFRKFEDHENSAKLEKENRPQLQDMRVVEFRRGSRCLFYKTRHSAAEFQEFDYLLSKHKFTRPASNPHPRGIPVAKKNNIMNNLLPLMPNSRHEFWKDLPTGDVADLIDNIE